jgi:hypothetical protein
MLHQFGLVNEMLALCILEYRVNAPFLVERGVLRRALASAPEQTLCPI